jgi:hypothetical protein
VVEPSKNQFDEEEMNEMFQHALTYKSNQAIASIPVGKFGAIASEHKDAKGGFFLVKWKSTSYTLQEETEVFGCGLMPAGTVVVYGTIYHDLQGNNKGWFQPPDYEGPNMPHDTIWVQHIVKGMVVGKRSKPDPTIPFTELGSSGCFQPNWNLSKQSCNPGNILSSMILMEMICQQTNTTRATATTTRRVFHE